MIWSTASVCQVFRDNADGAFFKDEAGHDAHFGFFGRNNSGAVEAYEGRIFAFKIFFYFDHIGNRDSFSDGNDDFDAGIGSFHDGIGGKSGRYKDDGNICAGGFNGIFNCIENGLI